jgi:hypothetical protein
MNEEVKKDEPTTGVTAQDILEENADILGALKSAVNVCKSRISSPVNDAAQYNVLVEALCKASDSIAKIRRDAFLVEAGILAQRETAKQTAKSILGGLMNGSAPNVPDGLPGRVHSASRGVPADLSKLRGDSQPDPNKRRR